MEPIYITSPDGRYIRLSDWADENYVSKATIFDRWRKGIRDPIDLITDQKHGRKPNKNKLVERKPPKLSAEKKSELRWLASFSRGQENQMDILCDLVPCPRSWGGWLKEELGL